MVRVGALAYLIISLSSLPTLIERVFSASSAFKAPASPPTPPIRSYHPSQPPEMRFALALAALVAATSALPSARQPVDKHALTTRQDFAEDDFEIQAEPDEKRQAVADTRSVDWPEVSPRYEKQDSTPPIHPPTPISPQHPHILSSHQMSTSLGAFYFNLSSCGAVGWLTRFPHFFLHGTGRLRHWRPGRAEIQGQEGARRGRLPRGRLCDLSGG